MSTFKTDQEAFWAGEFGDDYVPRSRGAQLIANNLALFARILNRTVKVRTVIEFGANIGLNLQAIRLLLLEAKLAAVEINDQAVTELQKLPDVRIHHQSILDYTVNAQHDFVLAKGLLIHLNPDSLPQVYAVMHRSTARYICLAEYYNPTPLAISYRGQTETLFKRDFAGEMLERGAYLPARQGITIRAIAHLVGAFSVWVDLSDHKLGSTVPVAVVALGACIIEKHFTILRSRSSADRTRLALSNRQSSRSWRMPYDWQRKLWVE